MVSTPSLSSVQVRLLPSPSAPQLPEVTASAEDAVTVSSTSSRQLSRSLVSVWQRVVFIVFSSLKSGFNTEKVLQFYFINRKPISCWPHRQSTVKRFLKNFKGYRSHSGILKKIEGGCFRTADRLSGPRCGAIWGVLFLLRSLSDPKMRIAPKARLSRC